MPPPAESARQAAGALAATVLLAGCSARADPAPGDDRAANTMRAAPTSTPPTSPEPPSSPAPTGRSAVSATETLIDGVTVIEVDGGSSYEITPADGLRRLADTGRVQQAWAQVVAQSPGADLPGMRDQFTCHVFFAAQKAVWHIEPWRPAVGYPQTVLAGCNPGPVADPDR